MAVAEQPPVAGLSHENSLYSVSYSSLSDLTASSDSSYTGDSSQSNRSSQNSALLAVDIFPTTEAEAEILSIYSGISGDLNNSESPSLDQRNPALPHSNFGLQHSTSRSDLQASCSHFDSQEDSHFSVRHFPSASSLFPLHTSPLPKWNARALSVPHLNSISTPKRKVPSKARSLLRLSTAKLLPRFLRPKRKERQSKDHEKVENSSFPILQLSEEPTSMGDCKVPHYYVTGSPLQMPVCDIPSEINVLSSPSEHVCNSDTCTECRFPHSFRQTQELHCLTSGKTIAPLPTIQNLVAGAREHAVYVYRVVSPDQGSVGSSSGYCSQSDLNVHSLGQFSSQASVAEQTSKSLPIRTHSLSSRSRYATRPSGSAALSLQSRSHSIH